MTQVDFERIDMSAAEIGDSALPLPADITPGKIVEIVDGHMAATPDEAIPTEIRPYVRERAISNLALYALSRQTLKGL